jgi:hypothetical protein
VKERLTTVDSSEEEPEYITYAELSDDDSITVFESEMADVIEEKWKRVSYLVMWQKEILF